MTIKVDFYVLKVSQYQSLFFACRLLENIYQKQQNAYVHFDSHEEAKRLDDLLWTYRDDSFLPHQLYNSVENNGPPILLGHQEAPLHTKDTLLNLSSHLPIFYKQFKQIIEIVPSDNVVQQHARERYKQYRDEGCNINTHQIKQSEV